MIYLLDSTFKNISLLNSFESFIWKLKYFGCGEMELHIPYPIEATYIFDNAENETAIVESVQKENVKHLYKGRTLKALLGNRVISKKITYKNRSTEHIVKDLVRRFAGQNIEIEPNTLDRGIVKEVVQVQGENLLDFTDELLQDSELSGKIDFDFETKTLTYKIFEGVDNSNKVPLTESFENLNGFVYTRDISNFKNFAYVAGEKIEGKKQKIATVDYRDSPEEEKREIWVNSTLQQNYTDENNQAVKLTDSEYIKALQEEGRNTLNAYRSLEKVEVDPKLPLTLGEKRLFRDDKLIFTQRVTEILIGYEKGAVKKEYTLGLKQSTDLEKVRKEKK